MLSYLRYLRLAPVSKAVLGGFMVAFSFVALLDIAAVMLIGQLITIVIQGPTPTSFVSEFFLYLGLTAPKDIIIGLGLGVIVFYFAKSAFGFCVQLALLDVSYKTLVRLRSFLLKNHMNLDYIAVVQIGFTNIATKVNIYADTYIRGIFIPVMRLFSDIIVMVALSSFLFTQNPYLFPVFAVFVITIIWCYVLFVRQKVYEAGRDAAMYADVQLNNIKKAVYGIKESKMLGKVDYFHDSFLDSAERLARGLKIHDRYILLPKYLIESSMVGILVLMIVLFMWYYGYQQSAVYTMIGYYAATAIRVMPSLNQTVTSLGNMRNATYIVEELQKDLNPDARNAGSEMCCEPLDFDNSIEFCNVGLTYPGQDNPAISNINLKIEKGEKIGIIGASGAGKTTFLDLFSGLITPTAGDIFIDDAKLSNANRHSWTRQMSFISQSVALFNASITENIVLGAADYDEETLSRSIKRSGLQKELEKFQDGLATNIGDDGAFLSGGQRQRIGVARALFHERQILILDEATSALDKELERKILQAIFAVEEDVTIVMISHDHEFLGYCDRVLEIQGGTVTERG